MMKTTRGKSAAKTKRRVVKVVKKSGQAIHSIYKFPDLTEFRKSIHVKGEPLSQIITRGRG